MSTTMADYARHKGVPLDLLRVMADSPTLCEAYQIDAGYHYMDQTRVTPLTTRQWRRIRPTLRTAVEIAEALLTNGFARADHLDEWVALVQLIESTL